MEGGVGSHESSFNSGNHGPPQTAGLFVSVSPLRGVWRLGLLGMLSFQLGVSVPLDHDFHQQRVKFSVDEFSVL